MLKLETGTAIRVSQSFFLLSCNLLTVLLNLLIGGCWADDLYNTVDFVENNTMRIAN